MHYYVYVHSRQTDGTPFYVGMGSFGRAYENYGTRRNFVWHRIKKKNGLIVEICQDGMAREDAYLLEMWLIAKFKNQGFRLANMTDGGEGTTGHVPSTSVRVCCADSSGKTMCFKHAGEAAEFLRSAGYENASRVNISSCARGERNNAYDRVWWRDGDAQKVYSDKKTLISMKHGKNLFTSLGETFRCASDAVAHLRKEGYVKAGQASISKSALEGKSAYGRAWSYDTFPDHPKIMGRDFAAEVNRRNKSIPVKSSIGEVYPSAADAARSLRAMGYRKATQGNISRAISDPSRSAYGRKWFKA